MSAKPIILLVGPALQHDGRLRSQLSEAYELIEVSSPAEALTELTQRPIGGVLVAAEFNHDGFDFGQLLQNQQILEGMPDGVVLLDLENRVVWANGLVRQWLDRKEIVGLNFYEALGCPEILGPDFCPLQVAVSSDKSSGSTIRCNENTYYQIHAVPLREMNSPPRRLIVTLRDVTTEILQQQKLEAIHQAGIELADLTTEEVFNMTVEERIELLKSNILHYTKDLLNFDVIEIRLLGQTTRELVPLLSVGMDEAAANRPLFASQQGYGVTGYVAETGRSYICDDTTKDPLYIEGCKGARSSLTVPLIQHDQVIGTFNVESPKAKGFSESDMQFLEIFSRDVANALNTLELLQAQQANTAQASVEAIHREVALPVDEILNHAVNVMERYIGHDPEVTRRLKRILANARDIKQLIQKVGKELAPAEAVPASFQPAQRPALRGRRMLVVDEDEAVRAAAHSLLDRFGCVVETAREGGEAVYMARNLGPGEFYDAIIADIRLPDCSGYDLLLKLREFMDPVPLILMTGFGYDPGHTIVKARRAGLLANAVLYKPFRLDQLLETVESVIKANQKMASTPSS